MADCCNRETRTTVRSEEEKKAIASRLNHITGQLQGIARMVELCGTAMALYLATPLMTAVLELLRTPLAPVARFWGDMVMESR